MLKVSLLKHRDPLEIFNSWLDKAGRKEINNPNAMTLQRENSEDGYLVWRDYLMDGRSVKSPVDIIKLPAGRYRLV